MPIPIHGPTALVTADATAAGSQAVTSPDDYWIHRFWITLTGAASVQIQGSPDGTTWWDLIDADITASDVAIVDRPYKHLRVEWAGNAGAITVVLEQLGGDPLHLI